MIFGKSYSDRYEEEQKKLKEEAEYKLYYAFLPVILSDGRTLLLDWYWFKHNHYQDYHKTEWFKSDFVTRKLKNEI